MRKEKREVTRSELQQKVKDLQKKNRELFKFLQIDRQRSAMEIQGAKDGVRETMLAMNLVLGEIVRKYGEVTIRMPDVTDRQYYNVQRDPENGTMTFRPVEKPAETAENGAEGSEEKPENVEKTPDQELPE